MKGTKFMKNFEIYDEENERSVGVILYYEKEKSVIIELERDLDEWNAPLLFTALVKRKIFTVPKDTSFTWVKERVIPSGRQNIGDILSNHKLKQYDEMKFLEISEGRCSQDNLCIRKIDTLTDYVVKNQQTNLTEVVPLEDNVLLCFFKNKKVKKVDLKKLTKEKNVDKILKFKEVYKTAKVGTGGYSVSFNDSLDIPAAILYKEGKSIPLTLSDFISFTEKNILDTTESCETLGCSRQNIAYMVKQNQLTPIKENTNGNLYLKGEILKNMW